MAKTQIIMTYEITLTKDNQEHTVTRDGDTVQEVITDVLKEFDGGEITQVLKVDRFSQRMYFWHEDDKHLGIQYLTYRYILNTYFDDNERFSIVLDKEGCYIKDRTAPLFEYKNHTLADAEDWILTTLATHLEDDRWDEMYIISYIKDDLINQLTEWGEDF